MRRLLILLIVAAAAAGCQTTPPQAYCRPTYTPTYAAAAAPCGCNPCSGGVVTSGTMSGPSMSGPVTETYGVPTIQTGPTVGPQSYAPTTN